MTKLHIGSKVIQQYRNVEDNEGKDFDMVAFVTHLPHPGGDPDKVQLVVLSPITSQANNLANGLNFSVTSQHGDKHGTFRYFGE